MGDQQICVTGAGTGMNPMGSNLSETEKKNIVESLP